MNINPWAGPSQAIMLMNDILKDSYAHGYILHKNDNSNDKMVSTIKLSEELRELNSKIENLELKIYEKQLFHEHKDILLNRKLSERIALVHELVSEIQEMLQKKAKLLELLDENPQPGTFILMEARYHRSAVECIAKLVQILTNLPEHVRTIEATKYQRRNAATLCDELKETNRSSATLMLKSKRIVQARRTLVDRIE